MGLVKTLLIIILLIIAIAHFAPNIYETGKNKTIAMVMGKTDLFISNQFNYTENDYGKDYGKIGGVVNCTNDGQCKDYFRIDTMLCSVNGTCYIEYE